MSTGKTSLLSSNVHIPIEVIFGLWLYSGNLDDSGANTAVILQTRRPHLYTNCSTIFPPVDFS